MKENVQTMVWVLEAVTFATAMAIAWLVWRISKRDSANKKSKPGNLSSPGIHSIAGQVLDEE